MVELFANGAQSDLVDAGRALARALPDCELLVLEGCTRSVLWERTVLLCERIAAVCAAAQAGPAARASGASR